MLWRFSSAAISVRWLFTILWVSSPVALTSWSFSAVTARAFAPRIAFTITVTVVRIAVTIAIIIAARPGPTSHVVVAGAGGVAGSMAAAADTTERTATAA